MGRQSCTQEGTPLPGGNSRGCYARVGNHFPSHKWSNNNRSLNHSNLDFEDKNVLSSPPPSGLNEDYLASQQHEYNQTFIDMLYEHLSINQSPEFSDQIFKAALHQSSSPSNQMPSSSQQDAANAQHTPSPASPLQQSPSPADPDDSDDSSSSSSSSTSSSHQWYSSSSSETKSSKKKGGKHKKKKKSSTFASVSSPKKQYIPTDTSTWSVQQYKKALQELMLYDWDMRGFNIINMYRGDEEGMFKALSAHKFNLEQDKVSKLQYQVLDAAKKQNLHYLRHEDDHVERRRLYSHWSRSLKTILS